MTIYHSFFTFHIHALFNVNDCSRGLIRMSTNTHEIQGSIQLWASLEYFPASFNVFRQRRQSLERESNRSDSKMRARHLLSCLTDGEILILLSSQSVELVHGMLSTHFCILLPKSNWSLLLSCSPAGLSVPAWGGLVIYMTG